ncbi:hypothetical protein [Yersinia mollaretii]|uniref:hypothetical protein n=1 Tax=Yersinia mollaretii TaxID=33060 RepID=UPI00061C7063|nr:hypothetical protein [Yersinia mollaretii]CNJ55418.1 Uncharacterised protein [Yersinia mollaretii]
MDIVKALQLLAVDARRVGNNDLFQVANCLFYRKVVMTKKELKWWHKHWLDCAKSSRKAGSKRSSANYLACAAAKRRIYQWDASVSIELQEAA